MENKFDDGIYAFLYNYWKEHSGEYDPKGNVVASNTANHLSLEYKTENELRFAQWAMREYGMTNKERTTHTFKGQMSVLLEVWNVVDMITLPISLVSAGGKFIGKEVAKEVGEELGEKAVKEVAEKTADDVIKTVTKVERKSKSSSVIHTINDLSQEQIDALIKYTGDDYVNINNSLRGLEVATPENQATINAMKSALQNASLPDDMVLYRGTSIEALEDLKNLPPEKLMGKEIIEPGFMSTSTKSAVANKTFSGSLQMKIYVSSGAHALDISSISQYSREAEILFNAGQKMTIISAESKDDILYLTVLAE